MPNYMNDSTILVCGATGRQGGAVARELVRAGFSVRAMTRRPDSLSAKALRGLGAQVVVADLDDVTSIESVLKGVTGIFSVQNFWEKGVGFEGEIRQAATLVGAAER